jgi:DNA (cytosine-5)-methyltransferase 1
MNELALFAGAGGGILGGLLLGWRTRCAVEINPYCRRVLLARQRDGVLPQFPIWDDVRTFNGEPWRGYIDVISGGFPCQDISAAGKGQGISGKRSGLWRSMARIIGEVRPKYVFVENSPMLIHRGLGVVLGDLASLGFDARWGVLGAVHVGAPHKRERIWILASHPHRNLVRQQPERQPKGQGEAFTTIDGLHKPLANADSNREPQPQRSQPNERKWPRNGSATEVANSSRPRRKEASRERFKETEPRTFRGGWWATEPDVGRMADGVASRMDRLTALGNGQVPLCAALAWHTLF